MLAGYQIHRMFSHILLALACAEFVGSGGQGFVLIISWPPGIASLGFSSPQPCSSWIRDSMEMLTSENYFHHHFLHFSIFLSWKKLLSPSILLHHGRKFCERVCVCWGEFLPALQPGPQKSWEGVSPATHSGLLCWWSLVLGVWGSVNHVTLSLHLCTHDLYEYDLFIMYRTPRQKEKMWHNPLIDATCLLPPISQPQWL